MVEEKLVVMEGNLEDEKVALLAGLLEGILEDEKVMGVAQTEAKVEKLEEDCLLYTSPSPRDYAASRMPSSA